MDNKKVSWADVTVCINGQVVESITSIKYGHTADKIPAHFPDMSGTITISAGDLQKLLSLLQPGGRHRFRNRHITKRRIIRPKKSLIKYPVEL
jgi:hypothetical protein